MTFALARELVTVATDSPRLWSGAQTLIYTLQAEHVEMNGLVNKFSYGLGQLDEVRSCPYVHVTGSLTSTPARSVALTSPSPSVPCARLRRAERARGACQMNTHMDRLAAEVVSLRKTGGGGGGGGLPKEFA